MERKGAPSSKWEREGGVAIRALSTRNLISRRRAIVSVLKYPKIGLLSLSHKQLIIEGKKCCLVSSRCSWCFVSSSSQHCVVGMIAFWHGVETWHDHGKFLIVPDTCAAFSIGKRECVIDFSMMMFWEVTKKSVISWAAALQFVSCVMSQAPWWKIDTTANQWYRVEGDDDGSWRNCCDFLVYSGGKHSAIIKQKVWRIRQLSSEFLRRSQSLKICWGIFWSSVGSRVCGTLECILCTRSKGLLCDLWSFRTKGHTSAGLTGLHSPTTMRRVGLKWVLRIFWQEESPKDSHYLMLYHGRCVVNPYLATVIDGDRS